MPQMIPFPDSTAVSMHKQNLQPLPGPHLTSSHPHADETYRFFHHRKRPNPLPLPAAACRPYQVASTIPSCCSAHSMIQHQSQPADSMMSVLRRYSCAGLSRRCCYFPPLLPLLNPNLNFPPRCLHRQLTSYMPPALE